MAAHRRVDPQHSAVIIQRGADGWTLELADWIIEGAQHYRCSTCRRARTTPTIPAENVRFRRSRGRTSRANAKISCIRRRARSARRGFSCRRRVSRRLHGHRRDEGWEETVLFRAEEGADQLRNAKAGHQHPLGGHPLVARRGQPRLPRHRTYDGGCGDASAAARGRRTRHRHEEAEEEGRM